MFNNLYNTCTYNYVCKQVHTCPCLPDRTNSRSPVREKHVYTHTSLPTRPHKWQIAGQGETHVYTHVSAYQTAQMADRRSERNTHMDTHIPAYQTAQMADRRSERNTRIHTHVSAYQTAQMALHRSERNTHIHTHTSLPTRPHKWQIAGQRETHIYTHIPAYQTAQMADRRSGRNTRTHTYILAYIYQISQISDSSSLVRKKYTYMYTYLIGLQVLLKSISCIAEAVAVAGLTLQRFSPLVSLTRACSNDQNYYFAYKQIILYICIRIKEKCDGAPDITYRE